MGLLQSILEAIRRVFGAGPRKQARFGGLWKFVQPAEAKPATLAQQKTVAARRAPNGLVQQTKPGQQKEEKSVRGGKPAAQKGKISGRKFAAKKNDGTRKAQNREKTLSRRGKFVFAVKAADEAKISKYRETIKRLRGEIRGLQGGIKGRKFSQRQALVGVKEIYGSIKAQDRGIDTEIKETKALMDFLEQSFLKRRIDEQTFRQRMEEQREKLHILNIQKKELTGERQELNATAKQIVPNVKPFDLEKVASTKNIEALLAKQQQTLEKIAKQGENAPRNAGEAGGYKAGSGEKTGKPTEAKAKMGGTDSGAPAQKSGTGNSAAERSHYSEAKALEKSLEGAPDSEKLKAFIEHKAGGKINDKKLQELEGKVDALMEKYGIPEKEIEKKIWKISTSDVMESISRLANIIELEKKTRQSEKQAERISTAIPVTESQASKPLQEIVGIATEIQKHRLVTDFDKIVVFITEKGSAKFGEISKQLGIPREKVEECCKLLKDEGQIEVVYPAFGEQVAQTLDYRERMELEKLKKKNLGKDMGKVAKNA